MNKANLDTLSLTQLEEMLGIKRQKMSLALGLTGVKPLRIANSSAIKIKQFSKRPNEILCYRKAAFDLGLYDTVGLSGYLSSPPELVRNLHEIGFLKPVNLHGLLFWNSAKVRLQTSSIDGDWIPVRAAALMLDVSIATVSGLVLAGHLPKIMPMNFLPGRDRLAIEAFEKSGIDASTFREADESDIRSGRLYALEKTPQPLHLLNRVATAHAFLGSVGHPIQIANGKFHLACGGRVHRWTPSDKLATDVEILIELINPAYEKY